MTDAWTIGQFAETARDMPATTPPMPTFTPGAYPTIDQDIIAIQHVVAAATAAGMTATWHHDNPKQVGEPIHATIRLPYGNLATVFPRVDRDGQWWFELLHFTPAGMTEGDWDTRKAASVDQVVQIAAHWRDNPPL